MSKSQVKRDGPAEDLKAIDASGTAAGTQDVCCVNSHARISLANGGLALKCLNRWGKNSDRGVEFMTQPRPPQQGTPVRAPSTYVAPGVPPAPLPLNS